MLKSIISDFSKVILLPREKTDQGLNKMHQQRKKEKGYNLFDIFKINQELLDYYQKLKKEKKLKLYIFTAGLLQNEAEIQKIIKPVFDEIFSAYEMNLSKNKSSSYVHLCQKINNSPKQVFYLDDSLENILAAKKAGLKTIQYIDNQKTFDYLKKLIK